MSQSKVEITTPDGVADAQFFAPDGQGPKPAVIMLTDIFGTRPAFEQMAERLASHGFAVLLANPYYRIGPAPGPVPAGSFQDPVVREQLMKLRGSLTPDRVRADVGAYLSWLDAQPQVDAAAKAGVIGYCMSGQMALRSAADFPERIGAAASFHGGGLADDTPDSPHLRADRMTGAKLLLGYATDDASMTPDMIGVLEAALTAAGVDYESDTYVGKHGFAVNGGAAYDQPSAELHWERLTPFLKGLVA